MSEIKLKETNSSAPPFKNLSDVYLLTSVLNIKKANQLHFLTKSLFCTTLTQFRRNLKAYYVPEKSKKYDERQHEV